MDKVSRREFLRRAVCMACGAALWPLAFSGEAEAEVREIYDRHKVRRWRRLKSHPPVLDAPRRTVRFFVMNASQKSWIEEKLLRSMEENLRTAVSSRKVDLVVEVTPDTETLPRAPYMPEEKARDLMSKNQNVKDFVAELGLDVK